MYIKTAFTFIFLILFVSLFSSVTLAQNNDNKQVSQNIWNLKQWNENNIPRFALSNIHILAKSGSKVSYNVTQSENNMTYPNSGVLSFGNLTNFATNNYALANEFELSIYPWFPGFVANPYNWTAQKVLAQFGASPSHNNGNLKITEGITNSSNKLRTSITFVFNQSASVGTQNTTLIYDKATGVLLYGYSEDSGNVYYVIELSLASSTLITGNDNTTPGFTTIFPLTIFVIIGLSKKIQTKKKK